MQKFNLAFRATILLLALLAVFYQYSILSTLSLINRNLDRIDVAVRLDPFSIQAEALRTREVVQNIQDILDMSDQLAPRTEVYESKGRTRREMYSNLRERKLLRGY